MLVSLVNSRSRSVSTHPKKTSRHHLILTLVNSRSNGPFNSGLNNTRCPRCIGFNGLPVDSHVRGLRGDLGRLTERSSPDPYQNTLKSKCIDTARDPFQNALADQREKAPDRTGNHSKMHANDGSIEYIYTQIYLYIL